MSNPPLADVVDIRRWLEEDSDQSYDARLARDREIGRGIALTDDVARLRAWWGAVRPADARAIGSRVVGLVRVAMLLLFAGGVLSGVGVGSVAFAYDGSHPVNLLSLLGALVGFPLLLVALTLLMLLPGRIPGFDALRDTVSVVNPGRWASAWLDRFSGLEIYGGFTKGRTGFARWQLAVFSQWFAVGFFVGVLGLGWVRVAVTDLAFGWSSTLDLGAPVVYGLLDTVAAPWKGWLPAAVPDLPLVEASRFNRLETAPISHERAVLLGGWWPFVLMAILVYGLLPRLVLLGVGSWRLKSATRSMFCQDPEVVALLDRLAQPRVTFEQEEDGGRLEDSPAVPDASRLPADGRAVIVVWNDAADEETARQWVARRFAADGAVLKLAVWLKAEEERAALRDIGGDCERLIVITKGWEPPVLEFVDFLTRLRAVLGEDATMVVVPIDVTGRSIDPDDRAVWARALAKHEDPRLYVMPPQGETA
jgi:hypothetical protein